MKEFLGWAWKISVWSLWGGFWACIGWDAARRLMPELIPLVLRALGR